MRPLFIFTLFLSGIAFLFANNIIPVTQMKLTSLKYEIIVSKPALDIKEGVFYDKIEGYVIKLGKKESNDSIIRNIVIFEKKFNLQDNMLVAESGVMRVSKDKKFLEFIMYNGWRYQERGLKNTTNTEFTRLHFKEYKKVFSLSSFQMNKANDNIYDPKMLSIRQLSHAIDSLQNNDSFYTKKMIREVVPYLRFMTYKDSAKVFAELKNVPKVSKFNEIISDSTAKNIVEALGYQFSSILNNIGAIRDNYKANEVAGAIHGIEWHRKFTLSFACIVLFLIGAPLGSIIRKGGLGTPLVIAIVFFVIFFLLNNFGEKFAKSGEWSVYKGMWLSTAVLIPVGAFLTFKAMRDAQLFNQEFYYRLLHPIKVTLQQYFKKK
jgi:lipopolysaccharide export system permease protein